MVGGLKGDSPNRYAQTGDRSFGPSFCGMMFTNMNLRPLNDITAICYNEDFFYRLFKMDVLGLNKNDEVRLS